MSVRSMKPRIVSDTLLFVRDFDRELQADLTAVLGNPDYAHIEAILAGGWLPTDLVNVPARVLETLERTGFVESLEAVLIKPSDAARVLDAFNDDRDLARSILDAFEAYGGRFLSAFDAYESIDAFRDSSMSRPDTLEVADPRSYRKFETLGGLKRNRDGFHVTPAGKLASKGAYVLVYG